MSDEVTRPKPGNFVVVKNDDNPEMIIRRYKQVSISKSTLRILTNVNGDSEGT